MFYIIPNLITFFRIPLLFIIVYLFNIYNQNLLISILIFICYFIGSISDYLDGYLARKYQLVSELGKIFDAIIDKIYIIGIFILLIIYHILPKNSIYYLLLIIMREFLVTGIRILLASKHMIITSNIIGKIKTFTQLITIGLLLIYNIMNKSIEFIPILSLNFIFFIYQISLVLFYISFCITLISGYSYIYNYIKKYY